MKPYTLDEISEFIRAKAEMNFTSKVYVTKETPKSLVIVFQIGRQKSKLINWIKPLPNPLLEKRKVKAYA